MIKLLLSHPLATTLIACRDWCGNTPYTVAAIHEKHAAAQLLLPVTAVLDSSLPAKYEPWSKPQLTAKKQSDNALCSKRATQNRLEARTRFFARLKQLTEAAGSTAPVIARILFVPALGVTDATTNNWYGAVAMAIAERFSRSNQPKAGRLLIELPEMPEPDVPREKVWVPFVISHLNKQSVGAVSADTKQNAPTIIIGHSSGADTVLRVIEQVKVTGAVVRTQLLQNPHHHRITLCSPIPVLLTYR